MDVHLVVVTSEHYADSYQKATQRLEGVKVTLVLYRAEEEAPSQIRNLVDTADAMLFGGPAPLELCRDLLPKQLPVSMIRLRPVDLALSLIRVAQLGLDLAPASIDTFDPLIIDETFAEFGVDPDRVATGPFRAKLTINEAMAFHADANQRLGTRYAITARPALKAALAAALDIPVITAVPSVPGIRASVDDAILSARAARDAASQFVAVLMRLPHTANLQKDDLNLLQLQQMLLADTELADTWIEPRGDRTLLMFAHRALMEKLTSDWTSAPLLEHIRAAIGVKAALGFGLGGTARDSVRQAEYALARANDEETPCAFLYASSGQVIGPIGPNTRPAHSFYKTTSKDLQDISAATGLGISTLTSLHNLEQQKAGDAITADDIAQYLRLTPQSGRRILRTLRDHHLVHPVGATQPAHRGRPSTLYQLRIRSAPNQIV